MQIRTTFITLLAVFLFIGCSKTQRPAGFPDLYPCEITITQEGQPLEGATVRLIPVEKFEWIITGTTNTSGIAKIYTYHGDFLGAPAGTFKVCVSKTSIALPDAPKPSDDDAAGLMEWNALPRTTFKLVEPEYENESQTPHSITVSKGKNRETFDVGKAVKIEIR